MKHAEDELVLRFLKLFARFEYALKASGFHNKGEGADAKADWDAFAKTLPNVFERPPSDEFSEAVAYILAHPPKKQIIIHGKVEWIDVERGAKPKADIVLLHIRCIRNNLFHGAKFNAGWDDGERDAKLLSIGILILEACLGTSPMIAQAFHR